VKLVSSILLGAWEMLLVAAPFLLFGMLLAGLLHVVLSRRWIERLMGQRGLLGVVTAAGLGLPLPLCSCSVVPVVLALRRKGASAPASLSFLITAPESGADSIMLTWGMLGPIMAIARPIASFLTALWAGVLTIAFDPRNEPPIVAVPHASQSPAEHHAHFHREQTDEADVVGIRGLWEAALRDLKRQWTRGNEPADVAAAPSASLRPIGRAILRYAFVELADDIAFWMVVGFLAAGVIVAAVPDDLVGGLGAGPLSMLFLLLISVPLYICASASTPIAAALVAKGVSPGAALVFLLAGPATNMATILLLTKLFGSRFVSVYLTAIATATLACGLALDGLLAVLGWHVNAVVAAEQSGSVGALQWLSALVLLSVLAWRLASGAARQGVAELKANIETLYGAAEAAGPTLEPRRLFWRKALRRMLRLAATAAAVLYLMSGFHRIPPGSVGYGMLFGRLTWPDLAPGLHYVPPAPFGHVDVWQVDYPRKADVGYRSDLDAIANRRQIMQRAVASQWHSPITAMAGDSREADYITGDENLVEISFTINYFVSDAYAFFYRADTAGDVVALYGQSAAREFVARSTLDDLLTSGRAELEAFIQSDTQHRLDQLGWGVHIASTHVLDLHPPQEAVAAFRDVSSAREDKETKIHHARAILAQEVPRARGQGVVEIARAKSRADAAATVASGQAEAFVAQASIYSPHREVLADVLWFETAERVLAGREKVIAPPGSTGRNVTLWMDRPPLPPLGEK
jgi:uncharacterized membrane protein YraQ (UPF0718 family)/regulator of protease activity HflC (stomatin/prohibitin superfamily)